jgi:Fe-S oxidoreductase
MEIQVFELPNVIASTHVRLCLDCGKCTVVCPVARYDPEFNPRLIVQAALRKNNQSLLNKQIWSCLGCNICVERCNYSVRFTDFIIALRQKGLTDGAEVEYSHGGAPQSVMHIMGRQDIKQNRLNWLPGDIEVRATSDTAFFVGCAPYFDTLFADLGVKTAEGAAGALRLLNHSGIDFTLLSNERCCGRDLLLMGDVEGFLTLARANQSEFNKHGIKNIITSCPECYYTLKADYPRFLSDWSVNVQHITEVIAPLITAGKLRLGSLKRKVTYHDPCTLGRYSRIFDQPRHILNSIAGLEVVEMEDNREKALCCGASPWVYCGSANKQIQKERLAQAGATGADVLVTACPKCQIHLKCAQKNTENSDVCQIEVQNLYSLAAQSLASSEVSS